MSSGDYAADLSSSITISLLLHSNLRNPPENAVVGRGPAGHWHWQGLGPLPILPTATVRGGAEILVTCNPITGE